MSVPAKDVGLIGLVAACLLFCSAHSFEPATRLYRAKPEDVPSWAEQGNFRFIRLDGGRIESWKAERTWWGKKFSAKEKDVLSHIYDRDFDQMLDLLKQADFNWIWVTWSNGWSFEEEDENRENLKKVIARCHENGIHVSAYLSASNMFRKSAYRDDPETKNYGLRMHGIPMFYAGPTMSDLQVSWGRRLADARKPGWRGYLLKKAELAVDAGVDAIVWDNMIGYDDGLAQLLDDTQRMTERKAQETGRPKVMVEANIHIAPDRFAMNDINEVVWEEDGKDTPGVWNGKWQVDNARKIKFLSGEKQLWQPLKYENDLYHCGPRERCIPSPAEQKLSIAEAYSFGAATSRNIEGRFLAALINGEPEAQEAWAAIAQYNHFLVGHRELYHQVVPVARIALISAGPQNALADEFLKQSVFFESKVLAHLDKGVPLDRFKVLVMPANLPKLCAEQNARLNAFTDGGGVIIRTGKSEQGIAARMEAVAGGPRLNLEPRGYVLGQLTQKPGDGTLILHLLNYDHKAPAENVRVRLDLSGLVQNLSRWEVKAVSPDAAQPPLASLSLHGSVAEFTLRRIDHYTVVLLSDSAKP
ncbi:MAG TPA: endo alpha-1,4 polygalactosaminidase [Candidatus Sulfotelmatobacter sp.]|nr:endo alpha-1,4 polygalactosaminidase [Candidatus Sulfotelmatobacter sp.]